MSDAARRREPAGGRVGPGRPAPAAGRAQVSPLPPSTVYFGAARATGEVNQAAGDINHIGDRAGRDIHQVGHRAGRDVHHIEHQHNAPDYYEHAKRFCSLAIAAFLLSLMFWPAALPVAYAARRRIRRTGEGGGGLTTASLAISWSMLFVTAIVVGAITAVSQGLVLGAGVLAGSESGGPVPGIGHAEVREQRIRVIREHGWAEFVPITATLGVGSTVSWANESSRECRLVATNDTLPDGTGRNPIRSGGSYRITFTEPGMYGFACDGDFASGGTIVVE